MIPIYAFWAIFSLIPGIFFSTWLLSLERMGFPLQDAAMTYAYFTLGQAIFELPTGYLADSWGRKRVTLIGIGFYALGFGGVVFADNQILVNCLLAVVGFGQTLISGAYQAWFLDVVEKKNRTHSKGINDHQFFLALDLIRRVNLGLGAWIGASLLTWSAQAVWAILASVSLIALAAGIFLSEDNVQRSIVQSHKTKISLSDLKENLSNPLLLGLLALPYDRSYRICRHCLLELPFGIW